jgi:ribosomal protein L11 methylase PrmA
LLPKLCDYVNYEGYLILSGLLEADQSIILAQKSLATEFSFEKVHKEGEWIALAFKKHASNPD